MRALIPLVGLLAAFVAFTVHADHQRHGDHSDHSTSGGSSGAGSSLRESQILLVLDPTGAVLASDFGPDWSDMDYPSIVVDGRNYPTSAQWYLDVSLKAFTNNPANNAASAGKRCLRIFDITAGTAVSGSAFCVGADDVPERACPNLPPVFGGCNTSRIKTGPFVLAASGAHEYSLQAMHSGDLVYQFTPGLTAVRLLSQWDE